MKKAFIDTTVLTDALLKPHTKAKSAKKALKYYDITELPVYAIKEFKAGPLKYFIWFHNKLATLQSFTKALDALHGISRSPRRYYTSTAIEALREASHSIGNQTPKDLENKYGENAKLDKIHSDEYRSAIKVLVFKAWKRRRKITTDIVLPLTCYREESPYEKRGQIEHMPIRCQKDVECVLSKQLRDKKWRNDIAALLVQIKSLEGKSENQKRAHALRKLYLNRQISEKECRDLGDAIFVLFAPQDATILTTNIKDFEPLASALGKKVERPPKNNQTDHSSE